LINLIIQTDEMARFVQSLSSGGSGGMELKISLQEIANTPQEILGPSSSAISLDIEELQTNISGAWSGQVLIVNQPLTLNIEQNGQDISGVYQFGTDTLYFTGRWEADQHGWAVNLSGITTYLRPFPGKRLWLSAPPVILSRSN